MIDKTLEKIARVNESVRPKNIIANWTAAWSWITFGFGLGVGLAAAFFGRTDVYIGLSFLAAVAILAGVVQYNGLKEEMADTRTYRDSAKNRKGRRKGGRNAS